MKLKRYMLSWLKSRSGTESSVLNCRNGLVKVNCVLHLWLLLLGWLELGVEVWVEWASLYCWLQLRGSWSCSWDGNTRESSVQRSGFGSACWLETEAFTWPMNSRIWGLDTSTSERCPQRNSYSNGSVCGILTYSRYLRAKKPCVKNIFLSRYPDYLPVI